ncbi:MAG: amino acid permease [Streptococcaceae bacterium]|jgi:amino acid transporter|nr:amino acid permease [Streptococcaceae bacterium]
MENRRNLVWHNLALMSFVVVWGFGNVVNNFANQGLTVVFSWILIFGLYFIPYALMVGELGSTFKDGAGGVSSWVKSTTTKRLAYLAGWTYWVVHIPYLAQKLQGILVSLGWVVRQDGELTNQLSTLILQAMCLGIFVLFLWLASRGISALKKIGTIAGMAMFVMSILYILLMIASPAIRGVHIATPNMNLHSFIPKFNFQYFTTISMLIFAVGGAEKISPYVNDTKDPSKNFPRGMVALAIMVAVSAILGSVAMGMMFDTNHIPKDLMMNGAYYAFQKLGNYYGLGNFLLIFYAIANFLAQAAALAFSIDAPLRVLINDSDEEFLPKKMRKVNERKTPVNGYILTLILVSLIIMIPSFGIRNMTELYNWLLNLNSVVMPMRYLWVFFAYFMLKKLRKQRKLESEYQFVKSSIFGQIAGFWCFALTAFACILGVVPKNLRVGADNWWVQLTLNIITPFVLLTLGLLMPAIVKLAKHKERG